MWVGRVMAMIVVPMVILFMVVVIVVPMVILFVVVMVTMIFKGTTLSELQFAQTVRIISETDFALVVTLSIEFSRNASRS